MNRREAVAGLFALALAPSMSCTPGRPRIAFDIDGCEQCRMTISDRRFAAAAISSAGRTMPFDTIHCMAQWTLAAADQPQAFWVSDAEEPGALIPLGEADLRRTDSGVVPMGLGFLAVGRHHATSQWTGAQVSWSTVLHEVAESGAAGSAS